MLFNHRWTQINTDGEFIGGGCGRNHLPIMERFWDKGKNSSTWDRVRVWVDNDSG